MEEQFKDIQKLVKEAGLEQPSSAFLKNVMQQVETSSSMQSLKYTPLISKRAWIVIAVVITALVATIVLFSGSGESLFQNIDVSFIKMKPINNPLKNIVLYKSAIYGFLFLGILFFIQVTFLKKRIDKHYSL